MKNQLLSGIEGKNVFYFDGKKVQVSKFKCFANVEGKGVCYELQNGLIVPKEFTGLNRDEFMDMIFSNRKIFGIQVYDFMRLMTNANAATFALGLSLGKCGSRWHNCYAFFFFSFYGKNSTLSS
jgi:hypothetical protein